MLRIEDSNDKEKIHVKNCVVVTKPDEIMKEVTCFGAGYLNHPRQRGFQLHRPRPLTRKGMLKLTPAVYFLGFPNVSISLLFAMSRTVCRS